MNECKGMNFTMTFDQVVRIDNGKGVIEQLQDDVKELQEEVGQLNTEVAENSNKLSGIEDGAERNVITGIKVNGKLIPPVNRIVDIPISGGANIPSLDDAVADGAQVNVIDSVSDEFEVSAEKQLSVKAIASEKITGLQGALDTKIEQVKVAGTALTITDKAVDIPAATAALLGVVKVDDVTIGSADGVISVKAVSTDLFQQGTDTLIWNGGTAQG